MKCKCELGFSISTDLIDKGADIDKQAFLKQKRTKVCVPLRERKSMIYLLFLTIINPNEFFI